MVQQRAATRTRCLRDVGKIPSEMSHHEKHERHEKRTRASRSLEGVHVFVWFVFFVVQLVASAVAAPSIKPDIVVARDGSGDFSSLQAAIDSVPASNRERIV